VAHDDLRRVVAALLLARLQVVACGHAAVVEGQRLAQVLLVGIADDVGRHRAIARLVELADQWQQHLIAERSMIDQPFGEQR